MRSFGASSVLPSEQRARLRSPLSVWLPLGLSIAALHGLGLLGPADPWVFPVLGLVSLIATVVALRRFRPARRWPWWAIVASLGLFVAGGAAREVMGTLGNLGPSRSLVPDLVTIPGYLVGASGLLGLGRARMGGDADKLDTLLDAVIAGLAALVLGYVYLLTPLLAHRVVPLRVRVILDCYPALSATMVALTARLGFDNERHGTAFRCLMGAMVCMFTGDLLYMLAEAGTFAGHPNAIDVPYVAGFVLFTACMLTPSMRELCVPSRLGGATPTRPRILLVGVALAVPAALIVSGRAGSEARPVAPVTVLLTLAGAWRLVRLLASHARTQRRLLTLATHDDLTGLPNRAQAAADLAAALATDRSDGVIAVAFLDLDRFKLINDTLGHAFGDALLIAVADRLRAAIGRSDLAARIGGDEFLVVMRVPDAATAEWRAAELLDAIRRPLSIRNGDVYTGASVGLAVADGPVGAEDLIRNADTAMYQAKASRRSDIVVFDASMRRRARDRLELEQDLRDALDKRQLVIWYQPIVRLPDERVVGVEALLRWQHPERGMLFPDAFVSIAEETGLIADITAWILDEACQQVALWRALPGGAGVTISVNVSGRQLHAGSGLLAAVGSALARHQLPGEALCLELTESMVIGSERTVEDLLGTLRSRGIRIAVDDFGTGYSSLAYLHRLSVDEVKVDRSFVEGLDDPDSPRGSLVAAIVAMAAALGLTTVAEGVETEGQRDRLLALGCPTIQGYLVGRPAPASEITSRLAGYGRLAGQVA